MKNAELGALEQCPECQMVIRRHLDIEGDTVELDLREAPVGLVPAALRWRVAGDGTALNLGWTEPAETVRVRHRDACHSTQPELATLHALWGSPMATPDALVPLPPGLDSEAQVREELRRQPTREQARGIACPYCDADLCCPCTDLNGEVRSANHKERATAYRRARWQTWLPKPPVPTRVHVRTVACPVCAAPAQESCRESNGRARLSNHQERQEAFLNPDQDDTALQCAEPALLPPAIGEVPVLRAARSDPRKVRSEVAQLRILARSGAAQQARRAPR